MKKLLFYLLLTTIAIPSFSQTKSVKKFYRKYKHTENTVNFNAPGWLIRLGASIAKKHVDDPTEKAALGLAKKVRKARILVMEDRNNLRPEDLDNLIRDVHEEGYEDLAIIREDGEQINLLIVEEKDFIRKMLILVNEEDSFIMLALKTKIHIDDINALLREGDLYSGF